MVIQHQQNLCGAEVGRAPNISPSERFEIEHELNLRRQREIFLCTLTLQHVQIQERPTQGGLGLGPPYRRA